MPALQKERPSTSSLFDNHETMHDTSAQPGDFLSFVKIIEGLRDIPDSEKKRRDAIRRELVEQMLDADSVADTLAAKVYEAFGYYRNRMEVAQVHVGDVIVDMNSIVTHKSDDSAAIGERYTQTQVTYRNTIRPETILEAELFENGHSRLVFRENGPFVRRENDTRPALQMTIEDKIGDAFVKVSDPARQRQILKHFTEGLLLSAEMQARRSEEEKQWFDQDARRMLIEQDAMFAPATSHE